MIKPPSLDGVTYENVVGPAPIIDTIDQRMVVAIHRFTRWLNVSEPPVEKILHLRISHVMGPPDDCHNQGRALDFTAVKGTDLRTWVHQNGPRQLGQTSAKPTWMAKHRRVKSSWPDPKKEDVT
jgi:hypothetical protein